MMIPNSVSRRTLLQSVLATATIPFTSLQRSTEYVGRPDRIEVYRQTGGRRLRTQSVASRNPVFLVLDAARHRLFAVNCVSEFHGLPRGTVESYTVLPANGHLELISRQPLSLSAVEPRHLAVAPDGKHLIVAVYGGGAYNVLPIGEAGNIEAVSQMIKEIGAGTHPLRQATAHPHSVIFDKSGTFVISSDLGSDCINVFRFKHGLMARVQQVQVPSGSGPAELFLSREGSHLSVRHDLKPIVACYRFQPSSGQLTHLFDKRA
jgi:6-phosphogluconolactonase